MIQTSTICLLGGTVFIAYVLKLTIQFRHAVKAIGNFPGYRLLLSPLDLYGGVSPRHISGVTLQGNHFWKRKYTDFKYSGWDMISTISAWPRTRTILNVADAAAIREIGASRARFSRPTDLLFVLGIFGPNVFVSNDDEWKKHRRISNPAFSEPNNKFVWEESVRATLELINSEWGNKEVVSINDINDVTVNLTLFVIGSAGFGKPISFGDEKEIPRGHKQSFKTALYNVSIGVIPLGLLPSWALGLSEYLRTLRTSKSELRKYIQEMIDERRDSEKGPKKHDLLSAFLDANSEETDGGESKLSDNDVISNIFIFLVAGHETSAHTLSFVFGLLALYQAEQQLLFEHLMSVLPDKRLPTYEDMNSLTHVSAVLYETLRLFPPVAAIPRKSNEDTTLSIGNGKGERITVPVPKDTVIYLDAVGLHYNPNVWKDPTEFRPQRFLEDWLRDGFVPFGSGARQCLGRRFSETESIAMLAVVLSRYKVEVMEEPQYAHETFEERKERVLTDKMGITTTPVRIPLVFRRR